MAKRTTKKRIETIPVDQLKTLVPPEIKPPVHYGNFFTVREELITTRDPFTGQVIDYDVERTAIPFSIGDGVVESLLKMASNNNGCCARKHGKYAGADIFGVVCGFGRAEKWATDCGWNESDQFCAFKDLVAFERKGVMETIAGNLKSGVIAFGELPLYLEIGKEAYARDEKIGGIIRNVELKHTWGGRYASVTLEVLGAGDNGPVVIAKEFKIGAYNGLASVSHLPVVLMTPEIKAQLTERGRVFNSIRSGSKYMSYTGAMKRKDWYGYVEFDADGRCMIDSKMMMKMDPNYRGPWNNDDAEEIELGSEGIPEDKLWMCDSVVYGFSMPLKKWGEFNVENIRPIEFREQAFDQLVMDPVKKKTVLALVQNSNHSFGDLIEGKGGGCIFLLHGPPGTGKTLTAEAVAEVLKRPLYSVSVGELGTNPTQLEETLRKILEVSTAWNAVVLLDEADIFLEARDEENIVRNAMVGVFLRLLEYHQGVMFLTTNRVRRFDKAFHSRISVAINYPDMSSETREKIWVNLLSAAGVEGLDPKELSQYDVNGRQIKNIIRLAQTLAHAENRTVSIEDVNGMVTVANDFTLDLEKGEDPV